MIAPIDGRMVITNLFGSTKYDKPFMVQFGDTTVPVLGHTGIDINCPIGTPIKAAWSGTVQTGWDNSGFGNFVRLTVPDGRTVLYGHLDSFTVVNGTTVTAGQIIAKSGNTGNSTGPHVHVEVSHINPDYLDGFRGCSDWLSGLNHEFVHLLDLSLV